MTRRVPLTARIGLSAALIAFLLWLVPFRQVVDALRRISPTLWLGAVALFVSGHVVAAFKWRLLLGSSHLVAIPVVLRAHFAGQAANLFLPGLVGGDVVRAAWTSRDAGGWENVGVVGLVDRLLDTAALLLLAFVGAQWTASRSPVFGYLLLVGAALLGAAAVTTWIVHSRWRSAPEDSSPRRIADAIGNLIRHPWRSIAVLALSLLVQASFVVITSRLGSGIGLDAPLSAWLVAWPLAKIVAVVPVTFAGIGTREGALAALMSVFGAPAHLVVATGLLWTSVLIAGALVGGTMAWASGRRGRRAVGSGPDPTRDARTPPSRPGPSAPRAPGRPSRDPRPSAR